MRRLARCLVLAALAAAPAAAQQIALPRVEQMPALPPDYRLLDWDRLAQRYDSLVFDLGRTGTYLPLAAAYAATANYPATGGFGLQSYVGSGNAVPGEAINALPALVGGTLVGADKRAQFGVDWVLRAQEYFNRRPEENVYLNAPVAQSGDDWWYDTMPNVFFYQLRALYPGAEHFDAQFASVADQWLRAVEALGGRTTPWAPPGVAYRGFALSTMTPRLTGVPEPEAAGAIAWLLYAAHRETGEDRYRIGAELALDALARQTQNPSYELQLPYGTLAASRMNAEVGTAYDLTQLLSWSFARGPLRGWGTLAGIQRGGYTLDGLVGEVDGDGYAFALNGYQQAAALVPVARYDDRYARALGRWMVNLASASRLFFPPSLPPENQDGGPWTAAHDPHGVIGYEALRGAFNGRRPFATGDALAGGWAPTNLALYGTSSVGYLAALVDSTDVPGILRLNLLATDAYHGPAYPSALLYNPHPTERTVRVPLGAGTVDIYDAVSDTWLARAVTDSASIAIPADAARVLVFPPAGGAETLEHGRLAVDGVVVDYRHGALGDRPPRIRALAATATTLSRGQTATLYCTAADRENPDVGIGWTATGGTLVPAGARATWSSETPGAATVTCTVTDSAGQTAAQSVALTVVTNQAPGAPVITATPDVVDLGGSTSLACAATDPDGDPLTYTWEAEAGQIGAAGTPVAYTAPDAPGAWAVICTATDPTGAFTAGTGLVVAGHLVLDLALDATATDASGFGHDGTLLGPTPTAGRTGAPGTALLFDGLDDTVLVPGTPALLPREAVTISLWARPTALPDRELFLLSHGSWQNRWKLSLVPGGVPRWTVRTAAAVADVDGAAPLPVGLYTHLAATYDGQTARLYVSGQPVGQRALAGAMPRTDLPLLLGQMVPGETAYNFPGALDDVQVYNRALSAAEIAALATGGTSAAPGAPGAAPFALGAPYPNPAASSVHLPLDLAAPVHLTAVVADVLGRTVAVLHDGLLDGGAHTLTWDAPVGGGVYLLRVTAGGATATRRVLVVR
jgi:hypothetical protein